MPTTAYKFSSTSSNSPASYAAYNPASGSPTQLNVGNGPVYIPNAPGYFPAETPWGLTPSGMTGNNDGVSVGSPAPAVPVTTGIRAGMSASGSDTSVYGTGPVTYADRMTLKNLTDREAFNQELDSMFGQGPSAPRKSWTEQLMDMPSAYMGNRTVGQRENEQNMWKQGYHKMPNPAKLDPNDYRFKFSEEYYRPGYQVDKYNPDTVWTKSGIPKAPPIPQY